MSDIDFDGLNKAYVQALYEEFARNPQAVGEEWREFFSREGAASEAGLLTPDALARNGAPPAAPAPSARARPAVDEDALEAEVEATRRLLPVVARATALIQAYREHGHRLATVDPLGSEPPGHPKLDPGFFHTSLDELEEIPASVVLGEDGEESVADALRRLREQYAGPIGYEFEHLEDPEKVEWFISHVEAHEPAESLDDEQKRWLLERLSRVEGMEQFLHRAYLGQKRFSVEGNDMLVPMLEVGIRDAARAGCRKVMLGMAHRGRLNVLAHIVGVEYDEILREFEGMEARGELSVPHGTGDVKYHHGARGEYRTPDGDSVAIRMAPNPSHLEFVNPVVEGMTRVLQFDGTGRDAERETESVVPILLHGDAAFAAEGVVAETLNLANLEGYETGGTIHLIVNNQIGFTTRPHDGRSTYYASDLAKGYDIPVLHVNADEPTACIRAMRTALAYRQRYGADVLIDLVGYRRHGHNEGDEPAYTQPVLYETIDEHPTVRTIWARKLVEEGVVSDDEVEAMDDRVASDLRDAQDRIREEEAPEDEPVEPEEPERAEVDTRVELETLAELNRIALSFPDDFNVHPKLERSFSKRREDFGAGTELDWAHAETLAFASLLRQGVPVRLTGQDSERGTFSQRHLVLHDVETGDTLVPIQEAGDARFEIYNSPLTETAVLGFEYGYEVAAEKDMVLWEAQFGDFVNVAQVIIDQFISAGRAKWGQRARLTMLLPHGYEGQGPEHSSARLERFLQLCAEDNLRVVYPSTPGQYFHMLRRQAHATPERPLIVMTPKSLLRHPLARTPVSELADGGFRPVIDDPDAKGRRDEVKRLVLCSGKVYYDLLGSDLRDEHPEVGLTRLEELYPFPADPIRELVSAYPDLDEIVWTQEEPRNMGALSYVGPRLRGAVPREIPLRHVSRPERASPAAGKSKDHKQEQEKVVREAFGEA